MHGAIDAMFHADTGAIDVKTLDVRAPHTSLEGNGLLGVAPVDRGSQMNVDLQSSDLSELDATLRTLKLTQGNRVGDGGAACGADWVDTGHARGGCGGSYGSGAFSWDAEQLVDLAARGWASYRDSHRH